jgi:hypothetical protein
MSNLNIARGELAQEDIVFDNSNNPDAEAFSIELSEIDSSWGDNFHLWVNGELRATFRSFNGLVRRAELLVNTNQLERVEQ